MSLLERFEDKYSPEPNSGCWLWTGAIRPSGGKKGKGPKAYYGCMMLWPRCEAAHRVAWELYRGAIPESMHVLHHCDMPLCVNPDHLFLGTHSDNMRDCVAKGRKNMPTGADHWRHRGVE